MSKDPAFLFYSKDWLSGCQFMDMAERGIYITLLAAQHQNGRLDPKRVGFLLGFSWDMVSDIVKSKFETDESGMLFNERLEEEMTKRAQHSEKQRVNGKKGGRPPKYKNPKETQTITQTISQTEPKKKPLVNVNVNVNEDVIVVNEKGVQGEKQLTDEQIAEIPRIVEIHSGRALNDFRLVDSMRTLRKDLTEADCLVIIQQFAAVQSMGSEYYWRYPQFTKHLVQSSIFKNFERGKAKTKGGEAVRRNMMDEVKFDENGKLIL